MCTYEERGRKFGVLACDKKHERVESWLFAVDIERGDQEEHDLLMIADREEVDASEIFFMCMDG